jgi:hypothetical protein
VSRVIGGAKNTPKAKCAITLPYFTTPLPAVYRAARMQEAWVLDRAWPPVGFIEIKFLLVRQQWLWSGSSTTCR